MHATKRSFGLLVFFEDITYSAGAHNGRGASSATNFDAGPVIKRPPFRFTSALPKVKCGKVVLEIQ